MGIRHMMRVQAALDHALENHRELAPFFDANKSERFFLKNRKGPREERDAIMNSIGYGKDRAGNLPLRFGPLLPEGGRRRLNVAVTRARQKLAKATSQLLLAAMTSGRWLMRGATSIKLSKTMQASRKVPLSTRSFNVGKNGLTRSIAFGNK
jgi:hypothetical protein